MIIDHLTYSNSNYPEIPESSSYKHCFSREPTYPPPRKSPSPGACE